MTGCIGESKDQPDPILQIKDEWLTLRVRSMLIAYVEEWLDDEEATAATVVQTEASR